MPPELARVGSAEAEVPGRTGRSAAARRRPAVTERRLAGRGPGGGRHRLLGAGCRPGAGRGGRGRTARHRRLGVDGRTPATGSVSVPSAAVAAWFAASSGPCACVSFSLMTTRFPHRTSPNLRLDCELAWESIRKIQLRGDMRLPSIVGSSGSRTWNVAPCPGVSATSTVPPCAVDRARRRSRARARCRAGARRRPRSGYAPSLPGRTARRSGRPAPG